MLDLIKPSRVLQRVRPGKKPDPRGQGARPPVQGRFSQPADLHGTVRGKSKTNIPVPPGSFVIRQFEFDDKSADLTKAGEDHVVSLAAFMHRQPFPVLIEPAGDGTLEELDASLWAALSSSTCTRCGSASQKRGSTECQSANGGRSDGAQAKQPRSTKQHSGDATRFAAAAGSRGSVCNRRSASDRDGLEHGRLADCATSLRTGRAARFQSLHRKPHQAVS